MRIITLNVNGIRSAARKGFFEWLVAQNADVVCLQEIKAHREQLTDPIFFPEKYHAYFFSAQKKGYSGVALYCRQKPDRVIEGLGWSTMDEEGRYLQADFGNLSVASLYFPSGTSGDERQQIKFDCMARYEKKLMEHLNEERDYVICGDWNIAHKKIDIKNWRGNQKNSGFLPEERAWLDYLFDDLGLVDTFRAVNQEEDQYTWWSNRGQAWAKNVGWRIDYQIATPRLRTAVKNASIYKDQRFSDHAPLVMDYEIYSQNL